MAKNDCCDDYDLTKGDYDDTLKLAKYTTHNWLFLAIFFSFLSVAGSGSVAIDDSLVAPNSAAGRVIGRTDDLAQPGALRGGERTLDMHLERFPDGTINKWATWRNNLDALKRAMAEGKPIRDLSPGDLGGRFLNLERRFLEMKGWRFDEAMGLWTPPLP